MVAFRNMFLKFILQVPPRQKSSQAPQWLLGSSEGSDPAGGSDWQPRASQLRPRIFLRCCEHWRTRAADLFVQSALAPLMARE